MAFPGARRGKYNAKMTQYNGVNYHSQMEANYAAELDLRVRGRDIKKWSRQIPIHLSVYGKEIALYVIDFKIEHNDGSIEYVEVKGFETSEWKIKWRLFEAIYAHDHPEVKLTIVK